jgi:hypothetical protein
MRESDDDAEAAERRRSCDHREPEGILRTSWLMGLVFWIGLDVG